MKIGSNPPGGSIPLDNAKQAKAGEASPGGEQKASPTAAGDRFEKAKPAGLFETMSANGSGGPAPWAQALGSRVEKALHQLTGEAGPLGAPTAGGEASGDKALQSVALSIAGATSKGAAGLQKVADGLGNVAQQAVGQTIASLRQGDLELATKTFGSAMQAVTAGDDSTERTGVAAGHDPLDVQKLVGFVLREAYSESTNDLAHFAEKVQSFNEQKAELRDQIGQLTEAAGGAAESVVVNHEEQYSKLGKEGQLANIDLQNALQKQQQAVQLMSNVSKSLHDTAMAVIRKL